MKKRITRILALLLALMMLATTALAAGDPDIILVYKTHLDVGYVNTAEYMVNQFRTTYIDRVLDVFDANAEAGVAWEDQLKWTIPGWSAKKALEDWEGQDPTRVERINNAIQNGLLYVHALPHVMQMEAADPESIVRGLNFASTVARDNGRSLPTAAKLTDVPSYSWIVPTVLANAGVEFLHINCNGASYPPDVPPLFWWEGPDGSRILVMYTYSYGGMPLFGSSEWNTWQSLLTELDIDLPFMAIKTNNEAAEPVTQGEVNGHINTVKSAGMSYEVGTLEDYANLLLNETNRPILEEKLEVVRGDMPDAWIHGIMSAPNETKIARNTQPQIQELESLNTLNGLWGVSNADVSDAMASAEEDILRFWEHTWGTNDITPHYQEAFYQDVENGAYDFPELTWKEKITLANSAQDKIQPLLESELQKLADAVGGGERVVVYNGTPWVRDGVVSVEIQGSAPKSLKNVATGEILPITVSGSTITFEATDVPSMGYATYVFCDETPGAADLRVDEAGNVIENQYYKLTIDPATGSITSLLDKTDGNRELVNTDSQYKFSQYFNERYDWAQIEKYSKDYITMSGGWGWNDISKYGLQQDVPYLKDVPANYTVRYSVSDAAITATLYATCPDDGRQLGHANIYDDTTLTITLYADSPYIDIGWETTGREKDRWPMGDWISFPFAVENAEYRLYRDGGVIDPNTDIVKDSYVNFFDLEGGLTITDKETGKGIGFCSADAPLVSIGKTGCFQFDKGIGSNGVNAFDPEEPTVFLNLYNNQWDTNYPMYLMDGNLSSSMRIWSVNGETTEESLVTPSRETRMPLSAAYSNTETGTIPASKSGLSLSAKGVQVTAFGPNIDGEGTILRLWEQNGEDVTCTVTLPAEMQATSVQPVDLRGQEIGHAIPVRGNQFTVSIGANAPYSVRINYTADTTGEAVPVVEDLAVTESTEIPGNVTISWDVPADADGYNLSLKAVCDNSTASVTAAVTDGKAELSLEPGQSYEISATVVNGAGKRFGTASVTFRTSGSPLIAVADAWAGSSFGGYYPINTANGNGLTGRNPLTATHDNAGTGYSMWHTNLNPGSNGYVVYDLGSVYSIDKLYVWNMNQNATGRFGNDPNAGIRTEATLQRGFKNVKIEYSLTGEDGSWTALAAPEGITYASGDTPVTGYPFQFACGTGEPQMKATNLNDSDHSPIDFGGVQARYVRLTAQGTWGSDRTDTNDGKYWGLSEVMFTEDVSAKITAVPTDLTVETVAGVCPTLPKTVTATLENGNTRQASVTWDSMDPAQYAAPGTFTVEGTVYGFSGKVSCTVTVKAGVTAGDAVINASLSFREDGTAVLTWTDPAVDFDHVLVEWTDGTTRRTQKIAAGVQQAEITGLSSGVTVKFSLSVLDATGNSSDAVVLYGQWSGSSLLDVKTATASSQYAADNSPLHTIDKSGITGDGITATHDNNQHAYTMWHIRNLVDGGAWIQYDLGSVKQLDQLYVWNMNQVVNGTSYTARSLKNVKIEYSIDGETWTSLAAPKNITYNSDGVTADYPFQLAQGTGAAQMPATNLNDGSNTPITFNGVEARYVKITAKDSWGSANYWGLSEVMFTGKNAAKTIVSAEEAAVQTTAGVCPRLPERVTVTYDDGTTGTEFVTWASVTEDQYSTPGTFAVKGTVALTEVEAVCTLTVLPRPTDKTALNKAINEAVNKPQSAYTAESWAEFEAAYEYAIQVSDDSQADQDTVDQACDRLNRTMAQLEIQVSAAGFRDLLDQMRTLTAENKNNLYDSLDHAADGQYSRSAYDAMAEVLADAEDVNRLLGDAADGALTDYQLDLLSRILPQMDDSLRAFLQSQYSDPAPEAYLVTFDSNGGSSVPSQTVVSGSPAVEPDVPVRLGCLFTGWYTDKDCTERYDFSQPVTEDLTLYAGWLRLFLPLGSFSQPLPFLDVQEGDWFYDAVQYVYDEGIMTGVSENAFAPNGSVSRAMVWTVLARMEGENTNGGDTWYAKARTWAMVNGVSDGTDPMGSVTREQLAAMLYRYSGSPVVSGNLNAYPDGASVSSWAKDAMVWATQTGLITGTGDGTLAPQAGATRSQLATILMRFCTEVLN